MSRHCPNTVRDIFAVNTDRNYDHLFFVEILEILPTGGLARCSQDVQETFNYLAKHYALELSSRGGAKGTPWPALIMQRHLMRLHVCIMKDGLGAIYQLKYELRKLHDRQHAIFTSL